MDTIIERFIADIRKHVSPDISFELIEEKWGKMLVLRYYRFIVEKIMVDKYFRTKLELPDSICYNYIMPLRRRLEYINQPRDWRHKRTLHDLTKVTHG